MSTFRYQHFTGNASNLNPGEIGVDLNEGKLKINNGGNIVDFINSEDVKDLIDNEIEDKVKDGMLEKVELKENKLVFTFNDDAETNPIEIDITEIFQPDNYLTKDKIENDYISKDSLETKLSEYATEQWVGEQNYLTEHQDLTNYALKSELPTDYLTEENLDGYATEAWVNEQGFITNEDADEAYQPKGEYLTEHQDISDLATKGEVSAVEEKIPSLEGYATEDWVERKGYITEHQSLSEYATLEDVENGLEKKADELKDYFSALLKNYTLKSDDDIAKVIKAGGDVVVAKDVKATSGYTFTKEANVDLNGHVLDAVSNGNYGDNVVVGNGANVTISNGEIKPAENASVANASATIIIKTSYESHLTLNDVKVTGIHPIYLNSANENSTVTINGGEYYTTMPLEGVSSDNMAPAVYVGKGTTGSVVGGKVTINGGTFGCKGVVNNFLLNVEDVLRKQEGKEPRNFIEVFGGKYWNFDPSNNKAEGEGTNFVADGYHVEQAQDGKDTIYTVVKD